MTNISSKNTIQIVIASLSDYTEESLQAMKSKKIFSALDTTNHYTFWKDQLRTKVGFVLTEYLLLQAGISKQTLHSIKRNSFGKPFLPNHPVDFNVSHSGEYVVAVCSPLQQIGVDIEQNRTIDLSAYENIFHPQEVAFLKYENSPTAFFEVWTKKESLLKARGTGFQVDLAMINIFEISSPQSYFHQVDIPGYTCFVCSNFQCDQVEIIYCNTESDLLLL